MAADRRGVTAARSVDGERDVNAPIELVRRMVAKLQNAQLITYPHEAHFSTLCNHLDEIAEAIHNR